MDKLQLKRQHSWSDDSDFEEIPTNLIYYSSEENSDSVEDKDTHLRQAELKQENIDKEELPQNQKGSKPRRMPRAKSAEYFGSEKLVECRITEKIDDPNNKNLYPTLMGPHPIYAIDSGEARDISSHIVQLRARLKEWAKEYARNWAARENKDGLLERERLKGRKLKAEQNEQQEPVQHQTSSSRVGAKYNKYSLQFKKNVVRKILEQLKSDNEPKSLRFYVVREANLLGIHPKNITRWLQIKNIDRREGGRKAKFPALEFRLARFMQSNPEAKRKEVIEEAKRILKSSGVDESFNFSKGWYERFRVRLKQRKVTRSMQDLVEEKRRSGCLVAYGQMSAVSQSEQSPSSGLNNGDMHGSETAGIKVQQNHQLFSRVKIEHLST